MLPVTCQKLILFPNSFDVAKKLPQFHFWSSWTRLRTCAVVCVLLGRIAGFASGQTNAGSGALTLEHPVSARISSETAETITVDLDGCHAPELFLDASEPDLVFRILSPDGTELKTVRSEAAGWLVFSFPASKRRLKLVASSISTDAGRPAGYFRAELLSFPSKGLEQHIRAESLSSSAQALRFSLREGDVRTSIAKYRQAASDFAESGDLKAEALALSGKAEALLELSRHQEAIRTLDQAIVLGSGDRYILAWLLNLNAQVFLDEWESGVSVRYASRSLQTAEKSNDTGLMADALIDRAQAEYLTHDQEAAQDVEKALMWARSVGRNETIGRALRCKAWIEEDQGQLRDAISSMRQSHEFFQKAGDARNALDAMADIATTEGMTGESYSALTRHSQLASLTLESGNVVNYAFILENIGVDYAELNRDADAAVYFHRAEIAFTSLHHASGEMFALGRICTVELRRNQLNGALRDCRRSAEIAERLHDPKRIAIAIWRIGQVRFALGETLKAAESFRVAAGISDQIRDFRWASQFLLDRGDALIMLHRTNEAELEFEKALKLSTKAEYSPGVLAARFHIARLSSQLGNTNKAKQQLDIALGQIEAARRSVTDRDLQASYFVAVRSCHELYVDILMDEYRRDPGSRTDALALEISESSRARTLLDTLASAAEQLQRRQSPAPQELLQMRIAVERAYDQRLKLMLERGQKRDLDTNAAELTQAIDTLERQEDAQKADAASSPSVSGRTLSAAEIAAASKTLHSTFIEYELSPDRSYVWIIENGKIESHVLPARDRIESAVKEWRTLATARTSHPEESFDDHRKRVDAADHELPRVSADLSCMLLAPFLVPGMDRLVIVPDGDLDMLPFAALPENGCQMGGQPIAGHHQIVFTPSLSVLLAPHQSAQQAPSRAEVAILADPVFSRNDPRVHRAADSPEPGSLGSFALDLPRLLGTRDEARAIASFAGPGRAALYLDFDASLQTLLSPSLNNYRILHLATHGIFDESAPGFSGIVLSLIDQNGQPVFGYLKTRDVASLDLHFDLVVLSSCESGAGVHLSGGGVGGLDRAFLSAGAKSIVATLWSVDDDASNQFMTVFYASMLRDGLDPPEALRRSQLQIMRDPHLAAPYYWAGFEITSAAN